MFPYYISSPHGRSPNEVRFFYEYKSVLNAVKLIDVNGPYNINATIDYVKYPVRDQKSD